MVSVFLVISFYYCVGVRMYLYNIVCPLKIFSNRNSKMKLRLCSSVSLFATHIPLLLNDINVFVNSFHSSMWHQMNENPWGGKKIKLAAE